MKLGIIILLLSSQAAFAVFGNVVPNPSIPHRACRQTTTERTIDHLHKTAIMAMTDAKGEVVKDKDGHCKDTRQNLVDAASKLSGELKLNSAEVSDVNNATATIECTDQQELPSSKPQAPSKASANVEKSDASGFLYGNGEQFATSAHSIIDSQGNLYKSCVLRPGMGSEMKDKIPLNMSMVEIIKSPNGKPGTSIAVIKLKTKALKANGSPIEGLELNPTGKTVDFGHKVAMVTSTQLKGNTAVPGTRNPKDLLGGPGKPAIVQECERPSHPRIFNAPGFYGACTTTKGSSGGFGYSRDPNSKRVTVDVVFTGGGDPKLDCTPFNIETGQFAYGVIIDQNIHKRMMDFQARTQI